MDWLYWVSTVLRRFFSSCGGGAPLLFYRLLVALATLVAEQASVVALGLLVEPVAEAVAQKVGSFWGLSRISRRQEKS